MIVGVGVGVGEGKLLSPLYLSSFSSSSSSTSTNGMEEEDSLLGSNASNTRFVCLYYSISIIPIILLGCGLGPNSYIQPSISPMSWHEMEHRVTVNTGGGVGVGVAFLFPQEPHPISSLSFNNNWINCIRYTNFATLILEKKKK